jgi:hypothetical protein
MLTITQACIIVAVLSLAIIVEYVVTLKRK